MKPSRLKCALLAFAGLLLAACGEPERADSNTADDTAGAGAAYVEKMGEQHANDTPQPSGAADLGQIAAMSVLSETVEYGELGGKPLTGYLAYPETAHGGLPGILLFHEWWGLNDNIRAMADKLAAQGYVVLALDIYGGAVATTPQEARELMQQAMADRQVLNANIRAGWKFMNEEIGALSVAAMGWCLGGTLAFNTALLFPDRLDALVIYYGHVTGVSSEQLATLQMPILGIFGAKDSGIPVESVRRFEQMLEELGKPAEIVVYEDAGHAFANPSGENFRPQAAEDAWQKTLVFLDRTLNAAVNGNLIQEQPAPAGNEVTQ